MTNKKINLSKGGWMILLCFGILFLIPNYSKALPLSDVKIGFSSETESVFIIGQWRSVYTDYELYATEFKDVFGDTDGWLDAFCVENAFWTSGQLYALEPVPGNLFSARLIADKYWSGILGYNKEVTQLAIWEVAIDGDGDLGTGNFMYSGDHKSKVETIIAGLGSYSLSGNPIGFANSPPGSNGVGISQDYLVKGASVPDANIILLLGPALICLGVFSRKPKRTG